MTNGQIGLLGLEQALQNWGETIPEFTDTYADTNSVVAYQDKGPNEELRKEAFRLMGIPSTKVPWIISNLGVKPSDNQYGFTFTRNDFTKMQEALFLTKNQKVSLDSNGKIIASEEGVPVWASDSQSGLCSLYRNWSGYLFAGIGDLLDSFGNGRVQFIASVSEP